MADIGSLFGGLAQGLQAGVGLAQNQQRIGLATQQLGIEQQKQDLEAQKQEIAIQTLRNGLLDAQTQAKALAGPAQAEQSDAKLFAWMSDMRNTINADPGTRKSQLPVFAQQFKAATGKDLAPNVLDAFAKGDAATLTRALDDATQSIIKNGTSAQDVSALLTDPMRSAQWFANASSRAASAGSTPDLTSPEQNSLATQMGVLKRAATYADQRVANLTAALPNMTTQAGVDKINAQIQAWQQKSDAIQSKVADLSKPVSGAPGSRGIDPATGQTLWTVPEKSDVKSPERLAQDIQIKQAGRMGATVELTPESLDQLASTFNMTGNIPSLGYGAPGLVAKTRVINRAAELADASGESANAAATRRLASTNTLAANRQMRAQEEKLSAFERTAVKNADLALQASEDLDRLGVPFIDKLFISTQKAASDNPKIAKLQLYTLGFRNEFARIVTGATGVTSDTARAEVDQVLRVYMGKMSFSAAIEAAKQEMTNRLQGFREQNAAAMESIQPPSNGGPPGKEGAPAIAKPASKADYEALPAGQAYIAPDGSRRIKGQ